MNDTNEKSYRQLITQTNKIVAGADSSRDEKLQEICNLLTDKVDVFDWAGFYIPHPDEDRQLILGPFSGEPTEHTQISFGQGICGQAADSKQTFVVQDVEKADNYLSCSAEVKAEIVVPVMKGSSFAAELDIDSHTENSITEELRFLVEEICVNIAELF
jgi:GAF domain-containing protein